MIRTRELSYRYTMRGGVTVPAVTDLDLDVGDGEVIGFLGRNGAGKTTTVRMLTTLLTPTAGSAVVAGHDVVTARREVRRRIGYVAQASAVTDHLVGDELRTQAELYGLGRRGAARRASELAERFGLTGLTDRSSKRLSGGQRRRYDLALGLVHSPRVLFLDEPTTGLDPQSRAELWSYLRRLRTEHGVTVFLSTHYLDEADQLCDRVVIIDAGRVVAVDTAEALKRRVAGDAVTLLTDQVGETARVVSAAFPEVAVHPGADRVQFQLGDAQRRMAELLRELDRAGVALVEVAVKRPTLDDVFLRLTAAGPDPAADIARGPLREVA